MVRRPYHSPRIDVEELAPTARPVRGITHSSGVMRTLQMVPFMGDGSVLAVGGQRQAAQNVLDRYNVNDRLRLRLIKQLGARVGDLPPPVRLSPAKWSGSWCKKK